MTKDWNDVGEEDWREKENTEVFGNYNWLDLET